MTSKYLCRSRNSQPELPGAVCCAKALLAVMCNAPADAGPGPPPAPAAAAQQSAGDAPQLAGPAPAYHSLSIPAASDSSGAENGCRPRLAMRQSSFASSDTEQQMSPPPPDAKPQQLPLKAATARLAAGASQPAPVLASALSGKLLSAPSSGGDSMHIAAAAVKLEPMPYDRGGSGSGGSLGAVKAECRAQPPAAQQAAARALSNRQSAARSKVTFSRLILSCSCQTTLSHYLLVGCHQWLIGMHAGEIAFNVCRPIIKSDS